MTNDQLRAQLGPFLEGEVIPDGKLAMVSAHLDLLLKWNQRMNLTAIREPAEIVPRHFGESLFAARQIASLPHPESLIDLGSGAGFPGIPIKVWIPALRTTLVESRQKKATFLREVVRTLGLPGLEVANQRAEEIGTRGDVVTLRAVESFDKSLRVAAELLTTSGRLVLLIGTDQVPRASSLLPNFTWASPVPIPLSSVRAVLVGQAPS